MLGESFSGKNPSHFQMSPIVKSYIVGDSLLWSAWNLTTPIFAIFFINGIHNGNVQLAATGYSIYLVSRVVFELLTGPYLAKSTDRKKFIATCTGMVLISFAYLGFSVSTEIFQVFIFYALAGMGLGIASPAKNSLFSMHLDKNKESEEWSISDAISFVCMALATALGGLIAGQYGFKVLFYVAAIINMIGIIPYLPYVFKRDN